MNDGLLQARIFVRILFPVIGIVGNGKQYGTTGAYRFNCRDQGVVVIPVFFRIKIFSSRIVCANGYNEQIWFIQFQLFIKQGTPVKTFKTGSVNTN